MNVLDSIGYDLERDSTSWLICDSIEVHPFRGMTIFCSSPREDLSKQFRKRALELTMPVWTYNELFECRNLLYSNAIDIPYLRTRYFFPGGVPRLIFTNILTNAVDLIRDAVQSSPCEKLKRLVNSSRTTPDGDISHRLILKHSSNPFRETRQRYSSDYCAAVILLKYRQEPTRSPL